MIPDTLSRSDPRYQPSSGKSSESSQLRNDRERIVVQVHSENMHRYLYVNVKRGRNKRN